MHRETLLVKKLQDSHDLTMAYDDPAGIDIKIVSLDRVVDGIAYFHTGICIECPRGYYVQMHGRSSLLKHGWTLANNVGIIDGDYRGEIIVALQPTVYRMFTSNLSVDDMARSIQLPMTVCQLSLHRKYPCDIAYVDYLSTSNRGDGSFGSSNNK